MRLFSGLLLVSLISFAPASAQMSGRVTGAVVDASGAGVPGADVELLLAGGKRALLTTKTGPDGSYNFIGVRPASYDLSVESKGFVKAVLHDIAVEAAKETSLAQIKLALATVSQSVDVSAAVEGVQTSSAEIANVVTMGQISNLPILDRDVLSIMQTQPGVLYNGNSTTVINGLRTSYSDLTYEGINIQDNYIRDNALDFSPNKLRTGQVRSMTLITSNGNAASSGATETALAAPSGTNQFHGELFWYNRNNKFAANDWFNNQSGVPLSFLNQNQFGGLIGGPIKRDKLFFYGSFEGIRSHQQEGVTNTILTADARNGIFTYNNNGVMQKVNLLTLRGLTGVDSGIQPILAQVPTPDKINSATAGDGRNTGGYRFNQRANELNDNVTAKLDYNLSTRHAISGTYLYNRDNTDRPDAENDFSLVPKVYNPLHSNLAAASWRWTPSARLTNELRGGFNLTYGYFLTSQDFGPYLLTGFLFTNPVNEFMSQGRDTDTFNLRDDAAYQRGRHFIQFGFHMQQIRVKWYDAFATVPTYTLGMGSGQPALTRRELPGISNTDLANANSLLASLGGYIDSDNQTFNITSRTSGFVPGEPFIRHFRLNDYAFYIQDKWRVTPRLTLTLGLRYQLPGVVDERDSLEIAPVFSGSAVQTLLSNATLDFAGSSAGRPWYRREKKDFAPNFGFAWDVFGNGRTAIRGGYTLSYVNDQAILAPESILEINGGLQGFAGDVGLSDRVSTGVPKIPLPPYQVPLTVADNFAINPLNAVGMLDPNLRSPYVQQYSFGIQHEIRGTVLEARYAGNHVVGAYRAFDFNQVQVKENGFLPDFIRARNNAFLAESRGLGFNPNCTAANPGCQPLTVFPRLARNILNDGNVLFYLSTGEVGELATYLTTNELNGSVNFFQNPYALGTDLLTNYSSSSYNSLQLEARHRLSRGLSLEANYTFSKVLSDTAGDVQSRLEHFLDLSNPSLERARANFDLTHAIKADGFYELPFGTGHKIHFGRLDRVFGGWIVGGTMIWQSGAPFSIVSGRGTLNREARSGYNTATVLDNAALSNAVKFHMTGNGPMMIAQSAINPEDGSGVNIDGEAPFQGQVFYNPGPGELGALQRRMFDGPWAFNIDARVKKVVTIKENQRVELLMDVFNVLNHPTFWPGDQDINSTQFGVIGDRLFVPRILQFGLHYTF